MQNTFMKVSVGVLVIGLGLVTILAKVESQSLKKESVSLRTEVASTTLALASTTAKTLQDFKDINTALSIDAAKRSAVLAGFSDPFILRRYLTSTTTVAEKSDLLIPKGCLIAKSAHQGGYGDIDESKVLLLAFTSSEASASLYSSGQMDIYEVNCKR